MSIRPLALLIVFALATVTVRAADDEHPYKNAKVGDTVTHTKKLVIEGTGSPTTFTTTMTVTAKTDKKVTFKVTTTTTNGGKQQSAQTQLVVDLTKPFEPAIAAGLVGGMIVKTEKGKDVEEKITVNGKEYETTKTTYKVTQKVGMLMLPSEIHVWQSKDVPLGIVKLISTTDAGGKLETTIELKESGTVKDKK